MHEEIIELLDHIKETVGRSHIEGFEHTRELTQLLNRLNDSITRALPHRYRELGWHSRDADLSQILGRIEHRLNRLDNTSRPCALAEGNADRFPQFLTAMSDWQAQSDGRSNFVAHAGEWFSGHRRGVVVDPFIFKAGTFSDEAVYCDAVCDVLGQDLERIDIYYEKGIVANSIAKRIFDTLNSMKPRMWNFYPCSNLHDRVYLRHYQVSDTPLRDKWDGLVVGCSFNGIQDRPTYLVEMTQRDAADYAKLLTKLRNGTPAQPGVLGVPAISALQALPLP